LHRNLTKNIDPDYQTLQPQAGTQLELALHLSTIREFERSRVQRKRDLQQYRGLHSEKYCTTTGRNHQSSTLGYGSAADAAAAAAADSAAAVTALPPVK